MLNNDLLSLNAKSDTDQSSNHASYENSMNPKLQKRLSKLKEKFDEKFGNDYLEEHGFESASFKELQLHFTMLKKQMKNEQKEKKDGAWQTKNDANVALDEFIQFDPANNTYTLLVGSRVVEINELIADAEVGATFIFADGTHELTQTIVIERDDVTVKGESESGTILNFTFPEGEGGNAIEVTGGNRSALTSLAIDQQEGSNHIAVEDASTLNVGDVIYLSQANTVEYILENGWTNVSFEDADDRPFREVLVRIADIEGNVVTLASPLPFDFEAGLTHLHTTNLIENVSLSDFTVTSGITIEPNYNDFVNDVPEFTNTSVIMVQGADAIDLANISILDAPGSGFDFRSTIDLTADNLHVNGAHNLGVGGNGYGINLYETFDATITDLEVFNTRHAVLFSSWNAEVGNTIEVTETNRDINFHGSADVNNEVTVLRSVLEYAPEEHTGSGNGFWDILSGGGSNHAATDIYSVNNVVFSHAVGSTGTELIYGADGGAYLDGQGSQDTIIGGNGDDIVIGGTSRDVLTGGDGADLFIFRLGDAYDAITDFSGDIDNDRILIQNEDIQSFNDLRIRQEDADTYVSYGSNSTIILSNFESGELDADYFLFNTDFALT